jgi:hypothetical protein
MPNAEPGLSRPDTSPLPALLQSLFYGVTGIWPLVSPRTFQLVTGPKVDFWLVNTAGVLITAIAAALGLAGLRRRVTVETRLLGVGSALGLTAIDLAYVARRRISPVYLLDALAEVGLIGLWILFGRAPRSPD